MNTVITIPSLDEYLSQFSKPITKSFDRKSPDLVIPKKPKEIMTPVLKPVFTALPIVISDTEKCKCKSWMTINGYQVCQQYKCLN